MGIIIASLGQAMQCIVVAPRLLASIAADNMLRIRVPSTGHVLTLHPFSKLTAGEPR